MKTNNSKIKKEGSDTFMTHKEVYSLLTMIFTFGLMVAAFMTIVN